MHIYITCSFHPLYTLRTFDLYRLDDCSLATVAIAPDADDGCQAPPAALGDMADVPGVVSEAQGVNAQSASATAAAVTSSTAVDVSTSSAAQGEGGSPVVLEECSLRSGGQHGVGGIAPWASRLPASWPPLQGRRIVQLPVECVLQALYPL